jgi:hypothetical protein
MCDKRLIETDKQPSTFAVIFMAPGSRFEDLVMAREAHGLQMLEVIPPSRGTRRFLMMLLSAVDENVRVIVVGERSYTLLDAQSSLQTIQSAAENLPLTLKCESDPESDEVKSVLVHAFTNSC